MTQFGSPSYSVKYYRDGFYKLVRFDRGLSVRLPNDDKVLDQKEKSDGKLSQSLSRARSVVLQVGLCNDWDYFFTGTINPSWFDRYDLDGFYKVFSQWIRDCRKKYDCKIQYCLVPELHKDRAWHLHGFLRGIPRSMLSEFVPGIHPQKLIDNGFLNWGLYSQKFGFCSLAPIRDSIGCAFYVSKYITKDSAASVADFGAHTYYCSIGLKRAQPLGFVFGRFSALDRYITNDCQFCSFGYVDDCPWHFWLDYLSCDEVLDLGDSCYSEEVPVLSNVPLDDLQLSIFDLLSEEELNCINECAPSHWSFV